VPFVELDAIHHQEGWRELTALELRRRVTPIVHADAWVVDGTYRSKLDDLVLECADTVVWLDLPRRVWLPRLLRRTLRRIVTREELWNGNRESLRTALSPRSSVVAHALRNESSRRRRYPRELARFRVARLRSPREVDAFLRSAAYLPDGARSRRDRLRSRERASATHAAPPSPSQRGVSTT